MAKTNGPTVASHKNTYRKSTVSTNSVVLNGNIDPNAPVLGFGTQALAPAALSGTFFARLHNLPETWRANTPTERLTLAAIFVALLAPALILILVKIRQTKSIVESRLRAHG